MSSVTFFAPKLTNSASASPPPPVARDAEYEPSSNWSPVLVKAFEWWKSKASNGAPARRCDFDPAEWKPILPNIWILDVGGPPDSFRIRLVGTAMVRYLGCDPTGKLLLETFPNLKGEREFLQRYAEAIETARPIWKLSDAVAATDKPYISIETLILPFATKGTVTEQLLMISLHHRKYSEIRRSNDMLPRPGAFGGTLPSKDEWPARTRAIGSGSP